MSGALLPIVIETSDRLFGPCPKCSGTEVGVNYHDGKPHCTDCEKLGRTPPDCKYSDVCAGREDEGEHLTVVCQRCRFAWMETVS